MLQNWEAFNHTRTLQDLPHGLARRPPRVRAPGETS